ncbi:hypothetical protein [Parabacteroides sp. PF5-9]|uniref:hypothetical protein n=1 Tax=Parabacteroides sp. PF5-9 TaxID=1742404 RepID=UPI0024732E02|nr:hypothetical protein [Parabacteroides sp. PF5-9]MDH6356871.1 hypothetical protein [Parabacteroides sp. PF5-9]
MKQKTKERRKYEKELLFYLALFNELKGREGAQKTLSFLNDEIDKLIEILKQM